MTVPTQGSRGEIRFRQGDDEFVAGPGTLVWGPREVPHAFKVQPGGARALVIVTPGGFERMFEEGGVPARESAEPPTDEYDPQAAIALAERFGVARDLAWLARARVFKHVRYANPMPAAADVAPRFGGRVVALPEPTSAPATAPATGGGLSPFGGSATRPLYRTNVGQPRWGDGRDSRVTNGAAVAYTTR